MTEAEMEFVVDRVLERLRSAAALEQRAQDGPPAGDPLEANHEAFVARIREQEARGL